MKIYQVSAQANRGGTKVKRGWHERPSANLHSLKLPWHMAIDSIEIGPYEYRLLGVYHTGDVPNQHIPNPKTS